MVNDKELRQMLSQVDSITALKVLEEAIDLMKNIIMEDKGITVGSKKKFMFLYLQCMQHISLCIMKDAQNQSSFNLRKKFKEFFK